MDNHQEPACRLCRAGFPLKDGYHYGTQRLGMIPTTRCSEEYLRRNLNVARVVGAESIAKGISARATGMKRPPKWLLAAAGGIQERLTGLSRELAAYRDEVRPDG